MKNLMGRHQVKLIALKKPVTDKRSSLFPPRVVDEAKMFYGFETSLSATGKPLIASFIDLLF
jgi:hypothetical protein